MTVGHCGVAKAVWTAWLEDQLSCQGDLIHNSSFCDDLSAKSLHVCPSLLDGDGCDVQCQQQ